MQGYVNNLALDLGTLQARYSALNQQLAPSVHRYNTYWNSFEASGQPASDQPLDCPPDYTLVPADASGLVASGGAYNQFRWGAAASPRWLWTQNCTGLAIRAAGNSTAQRSEKGNH